MLISSIISRREELQFAMSMDQMHGRQQLGQASQPVNFNLDPLNLHVTYHNYPNYHNYNNYIHNQNPTSQASEYRDSVDYPTNYNHLQQPPEVDTQAINTDTSYLQGTGSGVGSYGTYQPSGESYFQQAHMRPPVYSGDQQLYHNHQQSQVAVAGLPASRSRPLSPSAGVNCGYGDTSATNHTNANHHSTAYISQQQQQQQQYDHESGQIPSFATFASGATGGVSDYAQAEAAAEILSQNAARSRYSMEGPNQRLHHFVPAQAFDQAAQSLAQAHQVAQTNALAQAAGSPLEPAAGGARAPAAHNNGAGQLHRGDCTGGGGGGGGDGVGVECGPAARDREADMRRVHFYGEQQQQQQHHHQDAKLAAGETAPVAAYRPQPQPVQRSRPTAPQTAAGRAPDAASKTKRQAALAVSSNASNGLIARRKNATRETTATLKDWLDEHGHNPYPTKGEKIMLSIITKMSLTQVSTWFANARRRMKKENKSWASNGGGGGSVSSSSGVATATTTTTSTSANSAQVNGGIGSTSSSMRYFMARHQRQLASAGLTTATTSGGESLITLANRYQVASSAQESSEQAAQQSLVLLSQPLIARRQSLPQPEAEAEGGGKLAETEYKPETEIRSEIRNQKEGSE